MFCKYQLLVPVFATLLAVACNAPSQAPDPASRAQEDSTAHHHHADEVELSAQQLAALDIRTEAPVERAMGGKLTLTGRVLSSPLSKARITSPIGSEGGGCAGR